MPEVLEGQGVMFGAVNGAQVIAWETSLRRKVVRVGNLYIYMLGEQESFACYRQPD
jgi:hypothetical protein